MLQAPHLSSRDLDFLVGGGEMGERMRAFDWSKTSLGPAAHWPQSLKTIVRVMLDSRYAMWMLWGPDFTFFCNDAYLPTVGLKRDWVLGARSDKVWEEIWPDIGPRIQRVLAEGRATWDEGLLLFLERSGFREESYHTFSYSPIYDDDSRIAGMLCVVTEVTDRVIGERRLRVLRDLAAASRAESTAEAGQRLMDVLAQNPLDVAFAALYLVDHTQQRLQLACHFGELDETLRPTRIGMHEPSPWPLSEALHSGLPLSVDLLQQARHISTPLWPDRVTRAMVLPIQQGSSAYHAVLVAGISPRRPLDDAYRGFFDLIVRQFAAALTDAQAHEAERARIEALAEIDRAKTAFFSNVSHEFRTPLTLLLGPLEDALQTPTEGLRADALQSAHRNALRLLRLVNTLLDFSRIEAGRTQSHFIATDLSAATQELASVFQSAMERAGLRYLISCTALPAPVYVDREMWEKIVLNLVSNAFKYTLQGEIRVALRSHGEVVELEVADTGSGIPPEALPQLFDRFYRVPGAQGRTHEGSGIGLSLVRELVKQHGGTIEVDSTIGRGSTFIVRIPFGSGHLPSASVSTTEQATELTHARAFVDEAEQWLPRAAEVMPERLAATSMATPPRNERSATILLVDDNRDMREYIARLLSPQFAVIMAADGQQALEIIDAGAHPDLVLSDVMMPRLDGFGLLKAIRSRPVADLPVIFLSARAGEEARIEGLDVGADDYLIKPFSARELITRVGTHIRLARVRRAAVEQITASEERVRLAIDEAGMATWDLDMRSNEMLWSRSHYEMLGLKPNESQRATLETWQERIHPDDRATIMVVAQKALESRSLYAHEYRVIRADNQAVRWLRVFGRFLYDESGTATRLIGVIFDDTERKEAELALREADQRKDVFLATLAHELRNPLAPIRNAAQILSSPKLATEQLQWAQSVIQRQVKHMAWLLDDLLDVARITQGKLELKIQPTTLNSIVDAAVEAARPLIDRKSHGLTVSLPAQPLSLNADPVRLAQVLSNLLTNAAKYTDAGGLIMLSASIEPDTLRLSVTDNGIGIAPEFLNRIFAMFSQVESTSIRSEGGLGIGLALVSGLTELHDGSVEARSAGLGQGSEFIVRLPLSVLESPSTLESSTTTKHVGRKILVADDNKDAADSLALLLEMAGHETRVAYDGRAALTLAQTFRPDAVLLDIGMPQMNGYEVARALRQQVWGAHTTLIALTGWGQEGDRKQASEAGFDAHLTKPVDTDALQRLLSEYANNPATGTSIR